MKAPRQDTERTRKSLLAAAHEVFSSKGYRDATVAEISERAGVNIAAINYHFGDKETLYRETWRHFFREAQEKNPVDGGVRTDRPVEERLKGSIQAFLRKTTDDINRGSVIVYMELANPTGLLEEVAREELKPLRQTLSGLVREMLGPGASDNHIRFFATSIMGLCTTPLFFNRVSCNTEDEMNNWRIKNVEAYADHVFNFVLDGLNNLRKRIERNKGTKQ